MELKYIQKEVATKVKKVALMIGEYFWIDQRIYKWITRSKTSQDINKKDLFDL